MKLSQQGLPVLEAPQGVCLGKELSKVYGVVDHVRFQLLHSYRHLR